MDKKIKVANRHIKALESFIGHQEEYRKYLQKGAGPRFSPAEAELGLVQQLQNAFQAGVEWAMQKAAQFSQSFADPSKEAKRSFNSLEGIEPMRRGNYGIYSGYIQPRIQRMRERAAVSPVFNPEKRSQEAVRAFERSQQLGVGGYQY